MAPKRAEGSSPYNSLPLRSAEPFAYDHQSAQTPRKGNGLCAPLDWGFIAPTDNFIAEFEANDPRLLLTVNGTDKAVYKLLGATNKSYIGNDDAPSNKIYIRFADVMLWKAEAYRHGWRTSGGWSLASNHSGSTT